MSSHLSLFRQVPLHSKFRFEKADEGKVFVKTSEQGAHHDGAFQPVSPDVLVFPVPNPVVIAKLTQADRTEWVAVEAGKGRWVLLSVTTDADTQEFNSLEDVVNHLGAA